LGTEIPADMQSALGASARWTREDTDWHLDASVSTSPLALGAQR
jgi:hypothetical protein